MCLWFDRQCSVYVEHIKVSYMVADLLEDCRLSLLPLAVTFSFRILALARMLDSAAHT